MRLQPSASGHESCGPTEPITVAPTTTPQGQGCRGPPRPPHLHLPPTKPVTPARSSQTRSRTPGTKKRGRLPGRRPRVRRRRHDRAPEAVPPTQHATKPLAGSRPVRLYARRHYPFRVPGGPVPRVAPDTRPGKTRQSAFALVRAVQGNSLRSQERRFESCRGAQLKSHKLERIKQSWIVQRPIL
jgi:hypothetical protein